MPRILDHGSSCRIAQTEIYVELYCIHDSAIELWQAWSFARCYSTIFYFWLLNHTKDIPRLQAWLTRPTSSWLSSYTPGPWGLFLISRFFPFGYQTVDGTGFVIVGQLCPPGMLCGFGFQVIDCVKSLDGRRDCKKILEHTGLCILYKYIYIYMICTYYTYWRLSSAMAWYIRYWWL